MWCQYIHIYHDIFNAAFYKVWVLYETLFPCTYINSVSHIFQSMVNVQNMSIYIPKISQCSVHTHTCAIHCASSTLTLHGLMMRACAHIKTVVSVCACRHTYLTIVSEHTAISVHLFLMTLQVTDNVQVKERIGVISSNSRVEDLLKCNTESKNSLCANTKSDCGQKVKQQSLLGGIFGSWSPGWERWDVYGLWHMVAFPRQ